MPLLGSDNNLQVQISTNADTAGIKQTQEGIQNLNKTAEESSGKVGGLNSAFSSFGNILKTVGESFIAYQLVNKTEQFFGEIIGAAGGLEQTNIAFQAMIGSAQEANSVFGQLVQYANVTPFQAKDIEDAARTLMAFGTAGQQTVDIIKQLGDVAAIGGANINDLARISGQIISSGRVDAREFLELIRDGGAGLVKVMAESTGGMANLRAEMDKGKVSSQVFLDALTKSTEQGGFAFQGAHREALTLNGRLSTLRDAATMAGLALIGIRLDPQLGLQIQQGGLFDQMKGGISAITEALNGLQPTLEQVMPMFIDRVHRLWDQFATYLGPSLKDLWHTITTQLMPALGNFWHSIIEPLIPVLGSALVGALYLTVNVLNDLLKIITPVINFMAQHQTVVYALAGAFLALKAAMMLGAAFDAVRVGFATIQLITLPSFMATLSTVSAAWVAAFPVAGILADIALVGVAIKSVLDAFHELNAAQKAQINATSQGDTITDIMNKYKAGKLTKTQETNAINAILKGVDAAQAHATGGLNLAGGYALVGENGPELVDLPRGASVYTNAQSQSMMRGASNKNITIHNLTVVAPNNSTMRSIVESLDQDTINISRGLTTARGMAA